jgi:HD superfamily phosphohydrolase
MEKRAAEPGRDDDYISIRELIPVTKDDIVHAAILHDVGHVPFSHATERVLVGLENSFTCANCTVADISTATTRRATCTL